MSLTLEEKVGQMMFIGFDGLTVPEYVLQWLREGRVGGVYLFSRNVDNPEQVAALTRACHEAAKYPILIGIDQEGGTVARLRAGFTESPGAMALAASGDVEQAREMSRVLGAEMQALGINWVFAPVVDLVHDINNGSVGARSLGVDKDLVARFARAQIDGFQEYVAATAKHFPGLGNSPIDTHFGLAVIDEPLDLIRQNDMVPFAEAIEAGVCSVMTTHTKFTALDPDHPATLSPVVIKQLLRGELGFDGLVSSDCLEMGAITEGYGAGESAVLSVLAGVDTIMFSHTFELQVEAYNAVLDAVRTGRISEEAIDESVHRIQVVKERYPYNPDRTLEIIRDPYHLQIAEAAARRGVILLKSDDTLFPLTRHEGLKLGLVESAALSESKLIDAGRPTHFAAELLGRFPGVAVVGIKAGEPDGRVVDAAIQLASSVDVLIVASRSAHVRPAHLAALTRICQAAPRIILVCLRNPYDGMFLPNVDVVLCSCGDSAPSLSAVVAALAGDFVPEGRLPVPIEEL